MSYVFKSIDEEWQGFAAMVFAKMKPAENQVAEMKKAFFAGAWTILNACHAIGEPHVPEEFGVAYMEGRHKECQAFVKRMMAEYVERN
jgi:hypothetical protein